ncbi:MAG TPA: hypothetical protein VNN08_10840 [Thermoanaerobaculia bacterium]|nr:hypothetical protein [Thermoanaerobaculia bacterium]
MSLDGVLGNENDVSVILPKALPVLSGDSRDEFLHQTTLLVLCDGDAGIPRGILAKIGADQAAAIASHGEGDRAVLASSMTLLDGRIRSRIELRGELARDREEQARLRTDIGELTDEAERITREIRIKRAAEIERRIADEAAKLDIDRQKAIDDLQAVTLKEYERQKASWEGTAGDRQRRVEVLSSIQERGRLVVEATATRASKLNDRMITKTVAGFLAWLGYATVPATGAVLAMLLEGSKFSLDWVLIVAGTFGREIPGPSFVRFFVLVAFFGVCLLLLLGSVLLVDKLVSRFDDNWPEQDLSNGVTIQLGGGGITRRSYVRLLASLPYVFAGCMLVAFVASAGSVSAPKELQSLLPTITNAVIGSAIALLATAVLMMYAIRIIEPREAGVVNTVRRAWEFVVAPLAMIIAVAVAVSLPTADRLRWGGWTLFMLLSSLSLAYGLVYHGIYKDADKAYGRLQGIEKEIRVLVSPPQPRALSAKLVNQQINIQHEYARDALRLERLRRKYRLPTKQGSSAASSSSGINGTERHWWSSILSVAGKREDRLEVSFDDLDSAIAPELVDQLRSVTRRRAELEVIREEARAAIRKKEELTSVEAIEGLQDRLATATGQHVRLLSYCSELGAFARKEMDEFTLAVNAAILAAMRLRGPFDAAAGNGNGSGPHSPEPPLLLESGESDARA